jgi:mannose-6-phosphate isomerase-like protein (cupin superfamily)
VKRKLSVKQINNNQIQNAEIVLPCTELEQTLTFFTDTLGLTVTTIFPADNPKVAVLSGYGIQLRLEIGNTAAAGKLRFLCKNPHDINNGDPIIQAPNGTIIEFADVSPQIVIPEGNDSFVLTRLTDDANWGIGRAGMTYRDLIPDRQGGRFIASHIRIPEGGPVADYVHYHHVRFQLIFCYKGWVKVVYEDQGEPFILEAGDCVIQPPEIRHRVLESSPGLEVIEIGCPAEHETFADVEMQLPTTVVNSEHDFSGQKFVRHIANGAFWKPWRIRGFECRDSGIGKATSGLAGVNIVKPTADIDSRLVLHQQEFLFIFVLKGQMTLDCDNMELSPLKAGDSVVIPKELPHCIKSVSEDLEFLEVRMADEFETFVQQ